MKLKNTTACFTARTTKYSIFENFINGTLQTSCGGYICLQFQNLKTQFSSEMCQVILTISLVPNSFFETNLSQIIKDENITNLVICGMMSHMCIDTTVRACKDYKLDVTLIEDACTTKSLKYNDETISAELVHKTFMVALNGMFAKVVKADHYLNK